MANRAFPDCFYRVYHSREYTALPQSYDIRYLIDTLSDRQPDSQYAPLADSYYILTKLPPASITEHRNTLADFKRICQYVRKVQALRKRLCHYQEQHNCLLHTKENSMASDKRTVDFLTEQMGLAGDITTRAMFGEYAAYCDGKVIAFICDDQLFVKPTEAGRAFLGDAIEEAPPYPGAKDYFLIGGDRCEDRDWLGTLIRTTADALPAPKPKKSKRQR